MVQILKSIAAHPCGCTLHWVCVVLLKKLWLKLNSVTEINWFAFRAMDFLRESLSWTLLALRFLF
jgi:hypothetical protein